MHVLRCGESIWLKHAEIEINFKLGFIGLREHATQLTNQDGIAPVDCSKYNKDYYTAVALCS